MKVKSVGCCSWWAQWLDDLIRIEYSKHGKEKWVAVGIYKFPNANQSSIFTDLTQTVLACWAVRVCVCVSEYFHLTHWNDSVNHFNGIHITSTENVWLWLCLLWLSPKHKSHFISIECWMLLLITFIFSCYEKCLRNVCSQQAKKVDAHRAEEHRETITCERGTQSYQIIWMIEGEMHIQASSLLCICSVKWTNELSNNARSLKMGLFICLLHFVWIDQINWILSMNFLPADERNNLYVWSFCM